MAIEALFVFNGAMDLALLFAVSRLCLRPLGFRRLVAASALGGLAAVLFVLPGMGAVPRAAAILVFPLLILAAFGFGGGRAFARLNLAFVLLSLLCGGVGHLLLQVGFGGQMAAMAAACGLVGCAFVRPPPPPRSTLVGLRIGRETFCALVDTGNFLREPRSGLAVMTASGPLLAHCDRGLSRRIAVRTALGLQLRTVYALRDLCILACGRELRIPLIWVLPQDGPLSMYFDAIVPSMICWEGYDDRDTHARAA